ncbi:MAG TPA: hypothetical protein VK602_13920 [Phyllobacterium sp.]|nr:hypothetical protein [Phyllobacterium sp.]
MVQPTQAQISAACAAARKSIQNYSAFDSSMVPDDALQSVVSAALVAALNVPHPATPPKGN